MHIFYIYDNTHVKSREVFYTFETAINVFFYTFGTSRKHLNLKLFLHLMKIQEWRNPLTKLLSNKQLVTVTVLCSNNNFVIVIF